MKWLSHILTQHIGPWLKSTVKDAKAWLAGIFTAALSAAGQALQTVDVSVAQAWTRRQWAFHALWTLGPALIAALIAGKPHQSADDIVAKLAALSPDQRASLLVGTDAKPNP
jgi:hypothetical protein